MGATAFDETVMPTARGMLDRVRRLERRGTSSVEKAIGDPVAFRAKVLVGIEVGAYDPADMMIVLNSVERWLRET